MKRFIISAVLLISLPGFSQYSASLRNAFKKSYAAESQFQYAKAIEEITPYDKGVYEVTMRLGWLNYANKKFLESCAFYKKAVDLNPKNIEARLAYVNPLASMEKWDKVIEQYKAIIAVDPAHASSLYRLGLIYYNRADYNKSWVFLSSYLVFYPLDFDGNSLAGWVMFAQGKKEEAISFFNKALLSYPDVNTFNEVLK